MGVANIIPGVSGGTIAFLMGIYEELVESIHSFDLNLLKCLLRLDIKAAFEQVNGKFLSALLLGILTAIFSLSHVLKWLLVKQPIQIYAFFFGLIFMTVFVIVQKIRKPDFAKLAVGLVSAVVMYQFVGLVPLDTPDTWWFLFISGAIAICTMILPGISGAFILILLGKYEYIIDAISDRNFAVLIIVAFGCGFGLIAFVRFLRWVLHRHYDLTLSVLAGMVLGSLRKVWPWKMVLETIETSKGKIVPVSEMNVIPQSFSTEVGYAIVLCLCGIALSLLLARFDQEK